MTHEQHSHTTARFRWFLFTAAALIMIIRAPHFFTEPRFWAEEGGIYFAHALRSGAWSALTEPHLGYYSFIANLATFTASRITSLEHAPLVTTLFAYAIQLLPISLLIWNHSPLFAHPWKKVLGVAVILFTTWTGEVWLNTSTSQFHLALASFLILSETTIAPTIWGRWSRRLALFLTGIGGAIANVFFPVYVLKAILTRKKEHTIHTFIAATTAIIQIIAVYEIMQRGFSDVGVRSEGLNLAVYLNVIWARAIVSPLIGPGVYPIQDFFRTLLINQPTAAFCLAILLLALLVWLFRLITRNLPTTERWIFLGGFLCLVLFAITFSTTPKPSLLILRYDERYFYVPAVILGLILVANISLTRPRTISAIVTTGMLTLILVSGIAFYRHSVRGAFSSADYPNWKAEVTKWREDATYKPVIWPPNWNVVIQQR